MRSLVLPLMPWKMLYGSSGRPGNNKSKFLQVFRSPYIPWDAAPTGSPWCQAAPARGTAPHPCKRHLRDSGHSFSPPVSGKHPLWRSFNLPSAGEPLLPACPHRGLVWDHIHREIPHSLSLRIKNPGSNFLLLPLLAKRHHETPNLPTPSSPQGGILEGRTKWGHTE